MPISLKYCSLIVSYKNNKVNSLPFKETIQTPCKWHETIKLKASKMFRQVIRRAQTLAEVSHSLFSPSAQRRPLIIAGHRLPDSVSVSGHRMRQLKSQTPPTRNEQKSN